MPKKNSHGGNRHKKMASKSFKEPREVKMRYAQKGESYARVTKMYGQGNMDVMCNDKVIRLCIIRKKFRGRNKRDNHCAVDSMVLVGLREWEVIGPKKKPKVDLLYTYNKSQLDELKNAKSLNKDILPNFVTSEENMDGFDIDRTCSTQAEIIAENKNTFTINSKTFNKNTKIKSKDDFDGIDWDDI